MQILSTKHDLTQAVAACKKDGKTIGLVPTMGALHAGHASLVKRAVAENDVVFHEEIQSVRRLFVAFVDKEKSRKAVVAA